MRTHLLRAKKESAAAFTFQRTDTKQTDNCRTHANSRTVYAPLFQFRWRHAGGRSLLWWCTTSNAGLRDWDAHVRSALKSGCYWVDSDSNLSSFPPWRERELLTTPSCGSCATQLTGGWPRSEHISSTLFSSLLYISFMIPRRRLRSHIPRSPKRKKKGKINNLSGLMMECTNVCRPYAVGSVNAQKPIFSFVSRVLSGESSQHFHVHKWIPKFAWQSTRKRARKLSKRTCSARTSLTRPLKRKKYTLKCFFLLVLLGNAITYNGTKPK